MDPICFATTVVIRTIAREMRNKRGASAVEYGMILAFGVIAMIAGLTALGHAKTSL